MEPINCKGATKNDVRASMQISILLELRDLMSLVPDFEGIELDGYLTTLSNLRKHVEDVLKVYVFSKSKSDHE